ncbi:hypothetical protein ACIXHO_07545 [Bacteroides fragilis]
MAKKKEEAFKEREEGLQNFPPLFSNDCNTGEEDKKNWQNGLKPLLNL